MFQSIVTHSPVPDKGQVDKPLTCQLCRRTGGFVRYGAHVTGKNQSVFLAHCTGSEAQMCRSIRDHTCGQCGWSYTRGELVTLENGAVRCIDCVTMNYCLHGVA